MADFESKLQLLSERGTPVGAEEVIERVAAELAGDPLVVVSKQREGILMTTTERPVSTKGSGPRRGLAWALVAFAAMLTVGGLYFAFRGGDNDAVDQVPTPTTPSELDTATMTDLEIVKAGVAALYSGDAETAADMFELPPDSYWPTDQAIALEAAYQEAIGGRLTLDCTGITEPGDPFTCVTPYQNALTDAVGTVDQGDRIEVVVRGEQIVQFAFPQHSWMLRSMGAFLALEGRFDGFEECLTEIEGTPLPESCAKVQMENINGWADWYQGLDASTLVENATASWFGGDCVTALVMSVGHANNCASSSDRAAATIRYESILGAHLSVENCVTSDLGEFAIVTCDVHYSNALNDAVGKAPAVDTRGFEVRDGMSQLPYWFDYGYPQDRKLRDSFRAFAEGGELNSEYAAAECASSRTPECANLMMDNVDEWAAWHLANN